jgi:hypothetical protein
MKYQDLLRREIERASLSKGEEVNWEDLSIALYFAKRAFHEALLSLLCFLLALSALKLMSSWILSGSSAIGLIVVVFFVFVIDRVSTLSDILLPAPRTEAWEGSTSAQIPPVPR